MSVCPKCGKQMQFVEQYGQWLCNTCGQYQQPMPPPNPGPPLMQSSGVGDLEFETVHSPSFSALILYLKQGQSVVAEKGAMMYMHRTIEIKTHGRKGGFGKSLRI